VWGHVPDTTAPYLCWPAWPLYRPNSWIHPVTGDSPVALILATALMSTFVLVRFGLAPRSLDGWVPEPSMTGTSYSR